MNEQFIVPSTSYVSTTVDYAAYMFVVFQRSFVHIIDTIDGSFDAIVISFCVLPGVGFGGVETVYVMSGAAKDEDYSAPVVGGGSVVVWGG